MGPEKTFTIFNSAKEKQNLDIINDPEKILYECQILLKIPGIESTSQNKFLRFYQSFMLLSNSKTFNEYKIAEYGFHLLVDFKYIKIEEFQTHKLKGFELVSKDENLNFFSSNHLDLLNIHRILKKKLNLESFHDHFKAIKKIGRGNFAIVYMALNRIDGKYYAVKAMNKAYLAKQKNGKASLENEIHILRSIDHTNLIQLDSVYETTNSYYIVMELFYGGNLKDYIKSEGVLSENKTSNMLRNILNGIKYLHSKNIMHRDIKPDNILFRTEKISDDTQVVLADLGLSTFNTQERYLYPRCGTPGFVAPEITEITDPNAHYGLNCDLFSFGVTLYFCLTGKLPYPGKSELMKENKDCNFDFGRAELYKGLSLDAKDLIGKLVCPLEKRLNIDQTLNHKFFKMFEDCKSELELNYWDIESENSDRTQSQLAANLEAFNSRLDDKNSFNLSPVSSPALKIYTLSKKKISNEKSLTFISLTPLLTGFVKTVKSLSSKEDVSFVYYDETIEEISMFSAFTNCFPSQEFKLIKKLK